jgi:branched-subunit amino acid ABC-type transport system permease component
VQFLQLLVSGVAQGCIYGLFALSFALVYKTRQTVVFAEGALMVLGSLGVLVAMALLGDNAVDPDATNHPLAHWIVIGTTGLLCGLLFALFRYSKLGMALQAASQNRLAAYYAGIPVRRLNSVAWGLAVAVAAVTGLLLAPMTLANANLGWAGLKALPAAVAGSLRGLHGAIAGGLLIGLLESFWGMA